MTIQLTDGKMRSVQLIVVPRVVGDTHVNQISLRTSDGDLHPVPKFFRWLVQEMERKRVEFGPVYTIPRISKWLVCWDRKENYMFATVDNEFVRSFAPGMLHTELVP